MSANTTGTIFRLTTFGESHGIALGGVVEGCPAGLEIDIPFIEEQLRRRRPGESDFSSPRLEVDRIEFVSGIFRGKSTGTPIAFLVRNTDQRSSDYDRLEDVYRPSHADFTYLSKYGLRDHRGGGRASARETLSRVAGGAIAMLFLQHQHIQIRSYVSRIGSIFIPRDFEFDELNLPFSGPISCPDSNVAAEMLNLLQKVKSEGDTIGGEVHGIIHGLPAGVGEPVFDKLHADLAKAMLSINAAKGFGYGTGFKTAEMRGSEHNDEFFTLPDGTVRTKTNHSGGIQGGISNGMDITFNVAFKPVPTLGKTQNAVNTDGESVEISPGGRHDICVVQRALPVVEAMAALVCADHLLRLRSSRL